MRCTFAEHTGRPSSKRHGQCIWGAHPPTQWARAAYYSAARKGAHTIVDSGRAGKPDQQAGPHAREPLRTDSDEWSREEARRQTARTLGCQDGALVERVCTTPARRRQSRNSANNWRQHTEARHGMVQTQLWTRAEHISPTIGRASSTREMTRMIGPGQCLAGSRRLTARSSGGQGGAPAEPPGADSDARHFRGARWTTKLHGDRNGGGRIRHLSGRGHCAAAEPISTTPPAGSNALAKPPRHSQTPAHGPRPRAASGTHPDLDRRSRCDPSARQSSHTPGGQYLLTMISYPHLLRDVHGLRTVNRPRPTDDMATTAEEKEQGSTQGPQTIFKHPRKGN